MFEFGKDLRRLFAQARESDDLGWLELVGAGLVEAEARQQSTDAGRVSCDQPYVAWLRAAALWREHARRTGRAGSLDRARAAAADAARLAQGDEQKARAAVEMATTRMLAFDLSGDPQRLQLALADLNGLKPARRGTAAALIVAAHARLKARQARLDGTAGSLLDAAALLDSALHGMEADAAEAENLRLDRASLTLEAGMTQRDPRLLDQAGRDLRALVEAAAPEYRPLTRARALALCGAGLAALAALADDATATLQARAMFDAAADQFTPDHSPLDWAAVQIARAADADGTATPMTLLQAEALTADGALVLGALARERRVLTETRHAEATGDLTVLLGVEARLRRSLATRVGRAAPLDWVADQIGLARVALAREALTGVLCDRPALGLVEAAEVAIEVGVPAMAEVARSLAAQMTGR